VIEPPAAAETPEPAAPQPAAPQPAAPQPAAPVTQSASSASAGGDEVQLGALDSPDDAERAWRDISGATPALFSGKEPDIQPATVNGKTFYRLRVGGFASKAAAATFCAEVSAAGSACTVANF
jgi:cell division septation protein DedD